LCWSLKHEWTNHAEYDDEDVARIAVFRYRETFWSPVLPHQTLGYQTPNKADAENAPAKPA
jgi:hypothetical protein